jgi:hypothetical protein
MRLFATALLTVATALILLPATANAQCLPAATPVIAVTFTVSGALTKAIDARPATVADARYHYRVRAIASCSGQPGEYSRSISTVVAAPPPQEATALAVGIPAGMTQPLRIDYLVPGFGETATSADVFELVLDAPWVTVFPASGALSAGGTTVQLTIDPTKLVVGSSSATFRVQIIQAAGSVTTLVPVSVALAPAVRPLPRDVSPSEDTLIIPGVAHAAGNNSHFQSDVRLANSSAESATYELAYTPTASNGTLTGKKTTIDVAAGETKALDDLVKFYFGIGMPGESGIGTLAIRPVRTASGGAVPPGTTFASSRTYNTSSAGTFGQFIPALPRAAFIGNSEADPLAKISLQQLASSTAFRTNVGFVEGAGEPTQLTVKLFDPSANLLGQVPFSLMPFEHRQLNLNDPSLFPGVTIADARLEVEVVSLVGLVTAYASVLDNQTSDPLLVSPVKAGRHLTARSVLPGVAELTTAKNFHTDMRIYHAGTSPVRVTFSYRPQTGDATAIPVELSAVLDAGEVLPINDVLPSLWGLSGTGGAVTLTTESEAPLVVSARTFSRNVTGGTFGQFIPAVRPADASGAGERTLEVLQLEQSTNFRSNLGIFEVTGNPATVEITGHSSATTTAPTMVIELGGGEFRQLGAVFTQLGLPVVYNGRVSVRVLSGTGRVSSYASVIDSRTEDPTYIPAQ